MPVPKGMKPAMWYAIENMRKHGKEPKHGGKGMKDENDSYLKPGQKDTDDMKSARGKAIMKKMGKK